MGVDVSFHIEVRRKNVWRPFIWQTPMEFCSDILKKDEDKEWQTNSCCYWCRYYHFRDFIEDCAKIGLPDDVSPEMKEKLSEMDTAVKDILNGLDEGYTEAAELVESIDKQGK